MYVSVGVWHIILKCRWCAALLVFLAVGNEKGSSLSTDTYSTFKQLEEALLHGNTSSIPNLDILADTFFPKLTTDPLCASIGYIIEGTLSGEACNHSFLWTGSYLPFSTGILLLSYSQSGITLKGFEWESTCLFVNKTELVLQLNSFNCSSDASTEALRDLTSQVRVYCNL